MTITELPNRNKSPVFGPEERGSVSTYSTPYGLPGFCGRYVNLQTDSRTSFEDQELVPPPLARGTILHKCYEHYHRDLEAPVLRPKDFSLGDDYREGVEEAARLWKAYEADVPRSALGPTLFSEQLLPRTVEERKVVEQAVGNVTFKFICDSVVELSHDQLRTLTSLDSTFVSPGAGIYITDFKSEGRKQPIENYQLGIQANAYFTCLNALRDEGFLPELPTFQPIMGTIFVRLIGNAAPKILLTFVPPPRLEDIIAMQNFFRWRRQQIDANVANYDACKGQWGKPCWYYRSGQCNRGADK